MNSSHMTKDILTTKHWAIFLLFLVAFALLNLLGDYFGVSPGDKDKVLKLPVLMIFLIYPLLVGQRLRSILSAHVLFKAKSNVSLVLDFFLLAIPYFIIRFADSKNLLLNGVFAVIGSVGFVRISAYPARELRSIELRRNAGIWEYTWETLQILYWPMGIWWIQPRINKIINRKITITE